MRIRLLAAVACALAASPAARAEDTRPPQISEVKASARGTKVVVEARITDETGVLAATCHHRAPGGRAEDSPMVKEEFSDVFRATFAGGPDTEYWIDATDLLGNGPATYGSASKAVAVGGATTPEAPKAVASATPPKRKAAPAPAPKPIAPAPQKQIAAAKPEPTPPVRSAPPVVDHKKPVQPTEGKDLALRMKIRSDSPITVAVLQARPHGTSQPFSNIALQSDGDGYQGQIPASLAHGSVEYFIVAKNEAGDVTHQGDGDTRTPFVIAFKPAPAASAAPPARAGSPAFTFSHLPPFRVAPGRPITVRAQVVPNADAEPPATVAVLWRGADSQDQMTEMSPDETGGWGGYKVQLPPQEEGAIFFQVVACDARAARCGVDTGSKRKWHATTIAKNPGTPAPMALDTVSSKAPPSLPE